MGGHPLTIRATIMPGVQAAVSTASEGRSGFAPPAIARGHRIAADRETGWVWMAVAIYVAVSGWWLAEDSRVPIWDAGFHVTNGYIDGVALSQGHFAYPFERWDLYPPLVHLLGGVTYLLLGLHPAAMTLASNLVFVPLLAFGCYGAGSIAAGRRAGVLAALFALGSSMFVSMSHEFMIDPPQAAMVAISVWAILASRRFSRPLVSLTAGVLCGLAMLTKETSVIFLGGLLAATFVRGGWRNWRGLLLFAAGVGVIAGPWYLYQWPNLKAEYTSIGQLYVDTLQSPPRFSGRSFAWYFWDLVNQQVGLPLTIAFAIGTVTAVIRSVRTRFRADSVLPELLAGALVGYLGITYLTHKDPRYSLPGLVYVAVLATFWLPSIRRRAWRVAATAVVAGFALINFVGMSTGWGGTRRITISLSGIHDTTQQQVNFLYPGQFTVFQNEGWFRGGPETDGDVPALIEGLHRLGITELSADGYTANAPDFNEAGISPYANEDGIQIGGPTASPTSAFLLLGPPTRHNPRPCGRLDSGAGIYVVQGSTAGFNSVTMDDPSNPHRQYRFICPGRPSYLWPRAGS